MKNTRPFYIVFQVLKVLLINICAIQPPDLLFTVVFISCYISRYHFSQILELHLAYSGRRFRHEFSFFNRFAQTPYPLNGQNPLSVTKVFCQCSLIYFSIHYACSGMDRRGMRSHSHALTHANIKSTHYVACLKHCMTYFHIFSHFIIHFLHL